jgi:hypothetical protein
MDHKTLFSGSGDEVPVSDIRDSASLLIAGSGKESIGRKIC